MAGPDDRKAMLADVPLFSHARHRTGALMSLIQVHWFIRLRWAFVGAAFAVLALERFITPDVERPRRLLFAILLLAAVNTLWMVLQRFLILEFHRPEIDEARAIRSALVFANAQVAVDLFLLTAILRYTGGVENPMAVFYLFHMGIGALLLKSWHALLQGAWAMLLYGLLVAGECAGWVTPHWAFLPQFPSPNLFARGEHVGATLAVMTCGVFATLYFMLHITRRLDERERQLREAYDALHRSEAAIHDLQLRRSRFMQTAAHQLKGPLASIETFVGLLADGVVPEGVVRKTYERMRQRCRDGAQQVSELLTLARVQEADPRRHRQARVDVAEVAREVCRRYAPLAESKHLRLTCHAAEAEPDALVALVEPGDLNDCISNLVENAIKYTQQGSVTVFVCRGTERMFGDAGAGTAPPAGERRAVQPPDVGASDTVCVTVSDTGMGMEDEALAGAEDVAGKGSVFDAFRRGNNALAAGIPGTGLGLAIVREVVEQAGGRVWVRSRLGEGSSFTVAIPAHGPPRRGPAARDTRASVVVLRG
ncbi:MAG: HAMP domain-containing histidine kinase [Planctomycetes bacterium]|nr:HAMP domain-containing histidine kinase [Planctomycetota bacterium]